MRLPRSKLKSQSSALCTSKMQNQERSEAKFLQHILFRKEGDSDFIAAFIKELDDNVRKRLSSSIFLFAIIILILRLELLFIFHKIKWREARGSSSYLSSCSSSISSSQELLCIITVGDEKQGAPGQLVVAGQADLVQLVGKMSVKQ